ncbi:MAG TPA: aldehyde dehydrogenase family protein, partial [Phototrophicaceae bacterium]|nr:aldehyde dehydrogenase family protein [Phototrophicaceae bacterium]
MSHKVFNPYDNALIEELPSATEQTVRDAISRAVAVKQQMADMPAHRRGTILQRASQLIDTQSAELATLMARESGKPMKYAKGEVARAVETFQFAAEEARRLHGETIPLDAAKGGIGKFGYYVRVPVGVIAAITPFNFPLNLVAHKVAPAIAAGCPIVLKPAPTTPLTSLRLADILQEAGLPAGAFEVVVGDKEVGEWLTTDPRIAMITFTGSPPVARAISQVAGLRRTTFELGGNAATIVDETVDLASTIDKLVIGSFAYSGQVCISVQRVYVHASRYDEFKKLFVERTAKLVTGDPLKDTTDLGPMITESAAARVEAWVDEAVQQGAQVVVGGKRDGKMLPAIVLEQVKPDMKVMHEEVFGPVVNLIPFDNFE